MTRLVRNTGFAGIVAVASAGASAAGVAAYGQQDQPLAQVEISDNCNNLAECGAPQGLGGGWVWIEIDQGGTGDVAGSVCGHDRHGHGGAASIKGDIEWYASLDTAGADLVAGQDPGGEYYIVTVPDPIFGPFTIAVPQTYGHYSNHPYPGVAQETQVAP